MTQPGGGALAEGRYKLVGVLGQGGMGTVYAAEDRRLPGKQWAIKEIRENGHGKEVMVKEAETLIRLTHPNLPHIVDYFESEDGKRGYLVMERIDGETLEERFERLQHQMPPKDIVRYAIQVCDALSYLHSASPSPIVHRDLKPSNLLIDRNERIVLIDFGTARVYKSGNRNDTVRIGTIGFASPEQLADEQTDPRTDLYSLGGILFYLLSGGKYAMFSDGAISQSLSRLPGKLVAVLDKLLKTDREERYADAAQVKSELEQIMSMLENVGDSLSSVIPAIRQPIQKKRIVALLSLYPGAGSTTIGLAMAGLLDRSGIDHAYIEHPSIEPVVDGWCSDKSGLKTAWWAMDTNNLARSDWTSEAQLRLLLELSFPIAFVDISHCWEDDTATDLLELADEIIAVIGARKTALQSERCQTGIERLTLLAEEGKRITVCFNDCGSAPPGSMLFGRIPARRLIKLPYHVSLRRFEWDGSLRRLINDQPFAGWSDPIDRWLSELLREWGIAEVGKSGHGGWFRRLLNRG